MKAKLSIAAGVLVSAGLFYLAFRNINFTEMLATCRGANSLFLIPLSLTIIFELFIRGLKWKLLLDPVRPVRVWDAFRLQAAGLALSNILPLRLGEIVRGTTGAGIFEIPVMTVFATILVERALDVIVLFMLLSAAVFSGGIAGGFLESGAYLWSAAGVLAAAVVGLVFIDEILAHQFCSAFFERFPRIRKVLVHLALGVRSFHSVKGVVSIFSLAAMQWLLGALNFYWVAKAFSIEHVVGLAKSVVLIFTAAVACSVPGMPGYFGNYEAAISKVLSSWGISPATSFAVAAYGHLAGYVLVTTLGLVFAYQMGHSLGKIWDQFGGRKN